MKIQFCLGNCLQFDEVHCEKLVIQTYPPDNVVGTSNEITAVENILHTCDGKF
jgi:hypothetical protein